MFRSAWPVLLLVVALLSVGCESADTRYTKHMGNAKSYLAEGQLQGAILSIKSALAAHPNDPAARKLLLECYLQRGAAEPARKLVDELKKALPDDETLPLMEARLLLLEKRPDDALELLSGYMGVHGETADALTILGDGHAAKELWAEALDAYDQATQKDPKAARAWFGKAAILHRLKRDDEAAVAAAKAVEADPHFGRAYLLQAALAEQAGDRKGAVKIYRQALKQDRRVELPARFGLGQNLLALKEAKEAAAQGNKLVKEFPNAPHGYFVRGVARYMQERYDDAVADLQNCLAKSPDHAGAQFYLALAQYQRKQWEQALGAAKALAAQHPGVKPVEMLIAELLLRTGDAKGAEKQARRALELAPKSAFLYRVLGAALIAEGDREAGSEALEKAQELAPDEKLEFALGDLYLSMNELDKASSRFEAAAAAHPEARGAQIRLFYTRLRQKDFDGALGLMESLLQKQPDDPMWMNLKGAALLAKKDKAGATAVWQQVVKDHPELVAAHLNLAGVYNKDKRWAKARAEYEAVLAVKPKHSVAHRQLAVLDMKEGKLDDAIAHLEQSLASVTDGRVAMALAAARLQKGDVAGAAAAADKATQIAPKSAAAWLQAGVIALGQGDLKGGEARLRKASELDPKSPAVWYHLGGVAAAQKRWDEARAHLKRGAALAPDDPNLLQRRVTVELATDHGGAADRLAADYLKGHPKQLAAYQLAAEEAEVRKRPEEARKILAQGRQVLGENLGILLLQGNFERRQGNGEKAEALYDQILAKEPKAAEVILRKAANEMAGGRFEEAAKSYESVLALAPKAPVALNNLAYLYSDVLGQPEKALELLDRVDPEVVAKNPTVRDTLGWAQLKAGKVEAAVATLAKVADELPEVATVRYHHGAAMVAAGDTKAGKAEVRAALEMGLKGAEEKAARALVGEK